MNEAKGYVRKTGRADPCIPHYILPDLIAERDLPSNKHTQFIQRIVNRLNGTVDPDGVVVKKAWNPMLSDIFHHALGNRNSVRTERRLMFDALVPAMIKMADSLTGILPRSCVTTLSDQCGVTTYGLALYDRKGNRLKDEDGKVRNYTLSDEEIIKKKAVCRVSRFLDWLEFLGLVIKHRLTDKVTGAELPMIIELTDEFYMMCGEPADKLLAARAKIIGWRKRTKKLMVDPKKTTLQVVAQERVRLLEEIAGQRQEYRQKRRLANRIKGMTGIELRNFARIRVNRKFSDATRSLWNTFQYAHKVDQEINSLLGGAKPPNDAMRH